MRKDSFLFRQEQGSVMLMSLLVLVIVLASVMSISLLMVKELKLSRNVEDAVRAFYAAESGIERDLFFVKQARLKNAFLCSTVRQFNLSTFNTFSLDAVNQTKPQVTLSVEGGSPTGLEALNCGTTKNTHTIHVPPEQTTGVLLYDPDGPIQQGFAAESLTLDWTDTCSSAGPSSSTLEVSIIEWSLAAIPPPQPQDSLVTKYFFPCNFNSSTARCTPPPPLNALSAVNSYVVRMTAGPDKNCAVSDLNLRAYDSDNAQGTQLPIPSLVTVHAEGAYQQAKVKLSAELPWIPQASGLYNFAVLSQQDIDLSP